MRNYTHIHVQQYLSTSAVEKNSTTQELYLLTIYLDSKMGLTVPFILGLLVVSLTDAHISPILQLPEESLQKLFEDELRTDLEKPLEDLIADSAPTVRTPLGTVGYIISAFKSNRASASNLAC